jgi:hypothetical protein
MEIPPLNGCLTVPREARRVKCSAATPGDKTANVASACFSRSPMPSNVCATMESMMRMMKPALLAMTASVLVCSVARADTVPPIKGNDTGGIISYNLVHQIDVRGTAIAHCAQYGKVPKLLGTQAYYGGYISFACKWVPDGGYQRPIRTRY